MRGISLSFCVQDILRGKIAIKDVESIQTDCILETHADWERILSLYSQDYWQIDPTMARLIVAGLRDNDAIIHPRTKVTDKITSLVEGHWIHS